MVLDHADNSIPWPEHRLGINHHGNLHYLHEVDSNTIDRPYIKWLATECISGICIDGNSQFSQTTTSDNYTFSSIHNYPYGHFEEDPPPKPYPNFFLTSGTANLPWVPSPHNR